MGDDNVKKLGARFQDGFLPMGEDVDAAAITYQTLDEIPICVPEGDKEGKDWFNPNADLHRVRVFPVTDTRIKKNLDDFNTLSSKAQKNRLSAQHDKPGDVEKSLEREKKELESGKRTEPGDLGTLRNPKTDEEIRRIQAMNYGYNLEVDDDTKLLVPKSPDSIYEMCRFASKGVDGGTPLLVYKKGGHKILDKQCQDNKGAFYNTLLGVELTNEEILELMTLLEIPKGDGCIDPNGDNKKYLSVTNKLSVEDVDGKLTKAILKSDKFTPERAKQIVAALQKAFEGARTDKGLKDGQKTMIWKILLGQIPATLAGIVGAGVGVMMYQLHKKSTEGKTEMNVDDFIKDVTEKLKVEKPGIVVVPEVEEIVKKVQAAMDSKHPHIILAGRSGSGKDLIAKYIQWLFLNDRIKLKRAKFAGNKSAGNIDATGMAAKGGLFKGMAAKVADALNKTWLGKPGIYHAQELQNWLSIAETSGFGPGSTSTNAFRMVLPTLEVENPGFVLVGTTSEIEKVREAVPDIERRMGKIINIGDFSVESLTQILKEMAPDLFKEYGIQGAEHNLFARIIAATKFLEQSPNSGALNLLDELAREAQFKDQTHIGAEDIAALTQEKAKVGGLLISRESAGAALDFIMEHPSIEAERARIAAQLIEFGKNPELVFSDPHEIQTALAEGQRERAQRTNGGGKTSGPAGKVQGRRIRTAGRRVAVRGADVRHRVGGEWRTEVRRTETQRTENPSTSLRAGSERRTGAKILDSGFRRNDVALRNDVAGRNDMVNRNPAGLPLSMRAPNLLGKFWSDIPGFAKMAGAFAALGVAAHKDVGLLTEEEHDRIGLGILGGFILVNPYTPLHLAAITPVFEVSKKVTEAGLDATGVKALKHGSATSEAIGTLGGFAGTEAAVTALGAHTAKYAGMAKPTIAGAHKLGWQVINDGSVHLVRTARSVVSTQAQNARIGLQMAAQTARQTGPAVAVMAAGAAAFAKSAGTAAAATVASSAAATTAVVVGSGFALGAGIHYSGVGNYIGTEWLGRKIGFAMADWIHPTNK